MTGHELEALDQFITTRLTDATLNSLLGGSGRVWQELAPQSITGSVVVYSFLSGPDTPTVGAGSRILVRPLYLVEAITRENSFALAHPIAKRVDELLLGASGQVSAANLAILGTVGEELIRRVEIDTSGVRYSHLGRRYRFICSAIS